MIPDHARRRSLLTALGFTLLRKRDGSAPPETQVLRRWLDTWTGIGHVVTGMQRQDYDLVLTRYDGRGWRATFFPIRSANGASREWPLPVDLGSSASRSPGKAGISPPTCAAKSYLRVLTKSIDSTPTGRGPSMPWFKDFRWDDENVAHIARHGVWPDEVEEMLLGDPLVLRGADDRYLAYGRTENDRWLFAVYVMRPRGRVRVLTARDMTEREKRLARRKRKG